MWLVGELHYPAIRGCLAPKKYKKENIKKYIKRYPKESQRPAVNFDTKGKIDLYESDGRYV